MARSKQRQLIGGVWWRQCTKCGEWLPETPDNYTPRHHEREGQYHAACKRCYKHVVRPSYLAKNGPVIEPERRAQPGGYTPVPWQEWRGK